MRRVVFAVIVTASVGCADPGDPVRFEPRVTVTHEDGAFVHGPGWTMHFPVETGRVVAPDSLILDGSSTNAFAGDGCPNETLVGTSLYPAKLAVSGTPASTSQSAVIWEGPAVVRIESTYAVPWTCSEAADTLSGTTTWTFFPSGRIVRHDVARPSTDNWGDPGTCDCGSGASYFFTSFYTFRNDLIQPDQQTTARMCEPIDGHLIAVSWADDGSNTRSRRAGSAFATVYDWNNNFTSIDPTEESISSALLIARDRDPMQCALLVDELAADPHLIVGEEELTTDENGVFVSMTPRGFADISAASTVPPFAVVLNLGATTHATVTSSVAHAGTWYTIQPVDDGTLLFWFNAGLTPGETIAIRPI